MMRHKGKSALEILGSPDDLKFRCCLTLFAQAALGNSDREGFNEALEQFYGGEPDLAHWSFYSFRLRAR